MKGRVGTNNTKVGFRIKSLSTSSIVIVHFHCLFLESQVFLFPLYSCLKYTWMGALTGFSPSWWKVGIGFSEREGPFFGGEKELYMFGTWEGMEREIIQCLIAWKWSFSPVRLTFPHLFILKPKPWSNAPKACSNTMKRMSFSLYSSKYYSPLTHFSNSILSYNRPSLYLHLHFPPYSRT